MRKTKSKIHREKEDEKRAIGKASLGKKFTFISSAWALSRLTFFDEDSYFSAFCEMCQKFTLRPLRSRTKSRRKRQHSARGLTDYDTICSSVQVPQKCSLQRISRCFQIFLFFF